jgi:predicted GTPase
MEVRIGVVYTPREIILEMGDDADTLSATIEKAVNEKTALLWLTDAKGRKLGIPTDKIAYVEIAGTDADRKVGFGSR